MEKSEHINELATALCKFQGELPTIDLDREVEVTMKSGGKYKFKYATMSNIVEKSRPLMAKNGLSYSQLVDVDGSVTTILMHTSGQHISTTLKIQGDNTPQGIGSAITYAKRYSLSAILGIVADDDDDANMASGNTFKTGERKQNQPKQPAPQPTATFPQLNPQHPKWKGAVEALATGTVTLERLKQTYSIFDHNEAALLKEVELFKSQTP